MCLAVPGKITKIEGDGKHAIVDFGGSRRKVNIMLIPDVRVGDYVLVHAGFAIQKLRAKDAEEILEDLRRIMSVFSR
ncbi:MAG: HypC/HybG/HupF family hydrogenase formation chaperone [Thermoplasmata archaeon]|nr:HypC/HybG/HupF family hydrogenase formation chaperone [Euryarchaeota archaeon]RLF67075.1 MAG: HypC/HybG/HupF family hydrogenase formation chaperone [Thermoplasmata archaeon]